MSTGHMKSKDFMSSLVLRKRLKKLKSRGSVTSYKILITFSALSSKLFETFSICLAVELHVHDKFSIEIMHNMDFVLNYYFQSFSVFPLNMRNTKTFSD